MAKDGAGRPAEWTRPDADDPDSPYYSRGPSFLSEGVTDYMERYGIRELADEGWKEIREKVAAQRRAYEAQPEVQEARAAEARAAAERARMRGELIARIHGLVPARTPRYIGSVLDRFSAEDLERLYHGGVEWGTIRPDQLSKEDKVAKQTWSNLLNSLGYAQDE